MSKKVVLSSEAAAAKPTIFLGETLPGKGMVTVVVKDYATADLPNYGTVGRLIVNALQRRHVNHQITLCLSEEAMEKFVAPKRVWSKSSRTLTVELMKLDRTSEQKL